MKLSETYLRGLTADAAALKDRFDLVLSLALGIHFGAFCRSISGAFFGLPGPPGALLERLGGLSGGLERPKAS